MVAEAHRQCHGTGRQQRATAAVLALALALLCSSPRPAAGIDNGIGLTREWRPPDLRL